jgi:pyridoxal phosphate enzyme (YggS family)
MMTLEELRGNLERVRERMARAAQGSGRTAAAVQLLAVTKTLPEHYIDLAWQAGVRLFGENRVQEAVAKYGPQQTAPRAETGSRRADIELHLIGHLQRNKARLAASLFGCVQSIDKVETAAALARACQEAGRSMDILLELNTSAEPSKFGFSEEAELLDAIGPIRELGSLRLRGLMTVGPFTEDASRIAGAFARLRRLYEQMRRDLPEFDVLSMGMSADFEIAIREGATMVRLGTILFGPRS